MDKEMDNNNGISEAAKYRGIPWSLAHITLNNFFYTWTFGSSIFPLFLSELGLPKDQIGIILSIFPFTGLLALVFGRKVAHWGRKRTYLIGYGIRKPIMASLLILPFLLKNTSYRTAIIFLFTVILTVAILRAIAETAFIPWFQEYIPNAIRGKYAAATTVLTTGTSILALAVASSIIANREGIGGYMLLIVMGAVIGLIGVFLMVFVPGGKPIPANPHSPSHMATMWQAVKENKNFRFYLIGMGFYTVPAFMLGSFIPLYLKEQLKLPADSIVSLEIFSMLGSAIASIIAGITADRIGSRKVMLPGLILSITIPIGWISVSSLEPVAFRIPVIIFLACTILYFFYGAFSSTASIAANRMLYNNVIPLNNNTPYTALYYAWAGFVGGCSPILAGNLLTSVSGWRFGLGLFPMDGYRLIFLLSIASFTLATLFYNKVRPDENI
jgi:MFS family permease